jgi:hypothetical protein
MGANGLWAHRDAADEPDVLPDLVVPALRPAVYVRGPNQVFKELAAPRTYTFTVYGRDHGSTIAYDPAARRYTVHPDG